MHVHDVVCKRALFFFDLLIEAQRLFRASQKKTNRSKNVFKASKQKWTLHVNTLYYEAQVVIVLIFWVPAEVGWWAVVGL